jgi:transposase, IS6 family
MPVVCGVGVQAYSPELNKRCRSHLKRTNKSYRVDETYIEVKGEDQYLYRAVDSRGQTIDFLLSAKRDAAAAKRFFQRVFSLPANPIPRVINVDKNPAYPAAVDALKATVYFRTESGCVSASILTMSLNRTIEP